MSENFPLASSFSAGGISPPASHGRYDWVEVSPLPEVCRACQLRGGTDEEMDGDCGECDYALLRWQAVWVEG